MVPVTNMRYTPMYLRVYNVLSIHGWSEVKPSITAENDDLIYEQPLIVACDDVGRHSDLEKR